MTSFRTGTYALFPAVILWGILLGGVVYSHIVFFPVYLSALPDSAVVVNGPYALNEAPFWMITHPILILTLLVSLVLNWRHKPRRSLILTSLGIYVLVLVVTALYFFPELQAFRQSPSSNIPPSEWLVRSDRWQFLSRIRGTVLFMAMFPLLFALTTSETMTGETKTI